MKLRFKRYHRGFGGDEYQEGEIIDYRPWKHEWQGMTEPERVEKGLFIHCYGMGEFDVFREDDVEPLVKKYDIAHDKVVHDRL